jgi:4-carboxymuconolactone decarboxylase
VTIDSPNPAAASGRTTHRETFEAGMAVRRAVMGDDFVERSLTQASDFTRPMQELVTEYCWGTVWDRPGLERSTRSLLNLAMLTVLGRTNDFASHVRGALTNGVSVQEIQEALLQTAIYAGVPAALESFRVAEQVIREVNGEHDEPS